MSATEKKGTLQYWPIDLQAPYWSSLLFLQDLFMTNTLYNVCIDWLACLLATIYVFS